MHLSSDVNEMIKSAHSTVCAFSPGSRDAFCRMPLAEGHVTDPLTIL